MKHSTGKPTKAHQARFEKLKELGCIACRKLALIRVCKIEIHHLNLGGKAGQKRRGHDFTIPLCCWHHQGIPVGRATKQEMRDYWGPSLKLESRQFRATLGTDDELLAETNRLIGVK